MTHGMTKARGVLLLLAAAALLWIVASQTWIAAAPEATGTVPGVAQAAAESPENSPVLVACAAIVAVAALLLALLERVGRWVVGMLAVLAALGYAATALAVVLGPAAHTGWAAAGLVLGGAVAATAAWVTWTSGRWQASARYDRSAAGADPDDPGDDPARTWDALSRGEDL